MSSAIAAPPTGRASPPPGRPGGAEASDDTYTIRFRKSGTTDRLALIVEDSNGTAYLFCDGALRARRGGAHASLRLRKILARGATWIAVPRVAPYTLAGLRALLGEAPVGR